MKNKLLLGAALLGVASLFTACTDDRDSNPTLIMPTEFVLNTPALAGETTDLKTTDNVALTWSQPKYTKENAPVNVTYEVQMSPTNTFTVSTDEADADASGSTKADYTTLAKTTTVCNYELGTADINKMLLKIYNWEGETDVPDQQDVYIRVNAFIAEGTARLNAIYSNTVKLSVKPYYQKLVAADPELWYLVGDCVGDGTWNAGTGNIGKSLIPLCPLETEQYDQTTGQGVISYTGYFVNSKGFKVFKNCVWDEYEWGDVNYGIDSPTLKANGTTGNNFYVPSDGYYTITLDTKKLEMSIKAAETTPKEYSEMFISGAFNGWACTSMSPVDTWEGAKPHIWTYDLTTDEDTELKFLADTGWATNWGASKFPYGWGAQNGDNIPVKAGSYTIIFNDITGYYNFYSKE